jgi:hypothetical protein
MTDLTLNHRAGMAKMHIADELVDVSAALDRVQNALATCAGLAYAHRLDSETTTFVGLVRQADELQAKVLDLMDA